MSVRRHLRLALAAACGLLLAVAARAGDLPPPPAGFAWTEAANGAGTFLRPEGWFTKEETHGDTQAFFITRTPIADGGRFDVGMTVNAFSHVARHGMPPSAWVRGVLARLAKGRQVLRSGVVQGNALEMNVLRVLDTAGGDPVVIHYIGIGDDAKDRAWLIFFEAPQSEWDADYALAQPMLNGFGL